MEKLKKLLNNKKIRVTKNKLKILDFLIKRANPTTAIELVLYFSKTDNINKSTVYRIMDELSARKVISKFINESGEYMYCFNNMSENFHIHLLCDKCGNYFCKNLNLESIANDINDFSAISINATIHGICKNCKNSSKF